MLRNVARASPWRGTRKASTYKRLEELQADASGMTKAFYSLTGMFRPKQFQAAAGEDAYFNLLSQGESQEFFDPKCAAVDKERYYTRFQIKGLHFWLAFVRLRRDTIKRESVSHYLEQMMEHFWEQDAMRKLVEQEKLDLLTALTNQKALQVSWHGLCKKLDAALEGDEKLRSDAMADVLLKNIYSDVATGEAGGEKGPASKWLVGYLLDQIEHHKALPDEVVLRGEFSWAPFAEPWRTSS
jgi:hypothetical protein